MAEAQRKYIDNKEYTVHPLPARKGIRLFVKWGAMLGPSMAKMAEPALRKADVTSNAFSGAVSELFTNLDEGPLDSALDELMGTVYESEKSLTPERYNVEFAGNLVGLCKVVVFALEAQFGDFYKAFATMGPAKEEKLPVPASSISPQKNK